MAKHSTAMRFGRHPILGKTPQLCDKARMIIPIRTVTTIRRTPLTNYILIAVNIAFFLLLGTRFSGQALTDLREQHLVFNSVGPTLLQFISYQFLHADIWHLVGNMLFLWVFGNSVNAKMGDIAYLLFYLAGGIFAAWGYATINPQPFELVGASGAIASITTAYLALFPRSQVVVLVWFYIVHFFEMPAMLLIGIKIIVWDNLVAPGIGGAGNVAHTAHLSGYLFGFAGAMFMLLIRALPRDQFDLFSLWKRWHRRRSFTGADSFGPVAKPVPRDPMVRAAEEKQLDEVSAMRQEIHEALAARDLPRAAQRYGRLLTLDPQQCLSEMGQLDIARQLYQTGQFLDAASAFQRFVDCYPLSREADNARLLLGILYARDLHDPASAERVLTAALEKLRDDDRRAQCRQWLDQVRAAQSST